VERAQERIDGVPHIASSVCAKMHAAMFELMRGDRSRTASNAGELSRVARDHDLKLWRAFGLFLEGWLKFEGGAPGDGREDMARGAELRGTNPGSGNDGRCCADATWLRRERLECRGDGSHAARAPS